jgi:hypothetical protein
MRRVLGDVLRELRWAWLIPVVVFTTGEVAMVRQVSPAHAGTLLDYCSLFTDLTGVMIFTTSTDALRMMRVVFTLPIRRRDFGAGLWLVNVIGPVLVTSAAKLLVAGIGRVIAPGAPLTLRWLLSSAIFDFAYTGSLCWLLLQAVRREHMLAVRQWLTNVYWVAGTLVILGGTLALGWYMPTAASHWNWPIGLSLVGMLGLTAAGFRQSEELAVYGGIFVLFFNTSRGSTDARRVAGSATRAPFRGRLSGPRLMLWEQFRSAAIVYAMTLTALVVMGDPMHMTPGFLEHFRQAASTMPAEIGGQLWALGWVFYFAIGLKRWQPSRVRVLRTLPISSREINVLLIMRAVVTGFAYWLALLPIYSLAPAGVTSWMELGSLAGLIGLTSLTSAAMLRWHRTWLLTGLAVPAVNYLLLITHPWPYIASAPLSTGTWQVVGLVIGIGGVVAASAWNQRLLTHSELYGRAA